MAFALLFFMQICSGIFQFYSAYLLQLASFIPVSLNISDIQLYFC